MIPSREVDVSCLSVGLQFNSALGWQRQMIQTVSVSRTCGRSRKSQMLAVKYQMLAVKSHMLAVLVQQFSAL
jgi:hypothetical protein